MLNKKIAGIGTALVLLAQAESVNAGNPLFSHPSNGEFKMQRKDPWLYVGSDWELKMPDKASHFYGSYVAESSVYAITKEELVSNPVVIGLGVTKEIFDAYREGFSYKDLISDALGLGTSLLNRKSQKFKAVCDYNDERIVLRLNWIFK